MLRRLLLLAALLCLGGALVAGVEVAREIVYQPILGNTIIARQYHQALARDPAHAAVYTRLYTAYQAVAASDSLRYAVHRAAGKLAALTGHPKAAAVQYARAWSHRPGRHH